MERKIGEVFEYNSEKYVVEYKHGTCDGCAFFTRDSTDYGRCNRNHDIVGCCLPYERKDRKGVIFVKLKTNDMKERNIKLSLEKAKEFYKKGGEFRDLALSAFTEEELTKKELPKTWDEYIKYWAKRRKGVRLSDMTEVELDKFEVPNDIISSHNKMIALHLLRDCYRQGWVPKWNDDTTKYCVKTRSEQVYMYKSRQTNHFLSFQDEETAIEFMENFKMLILQAEDLI